MICDRVEPVAAVMINEGVLLVVSKDGSVWARTFHQGDLEYKWQEQTPPVPGTKRFSEVHRENPEISDRVRVLDAKCREPDSVQPSP